MCRPCCPYCSCRDARVVSTHEGVFRGKRVGRVRKVCRNCGKTYTAALPTPPSEDEDHDEDGLPAEDIAGAARPSTRRNRDPDNPYLD